MIAIRTCSRQAPRVEVEVEVVVRFIRERDDGSRCRL